MWNRGNPAIIAPPLTRDEHLWRAQKAVSDLEHLQGASKDEHLLIIDDALRCGFSYADLEITAEELEAFRKPEKAYA